MCRLKHVVNIVVVIVVFVICNFRIVVSIFS